jgi:hypothetical protein
MHYDFVYMKFKIRQNSSMAEVKREATFAGGNSSGGTFQGYSISSSGD